ncbi:unnamed protein product, partial [Staurois parvus]
MDKKRRHITKRILNLTLEIIYLLTGEDYVPLKKSGDHVTPNSQPLASGRWSRNQSLNLEPPPPSLTPEKKNDKKILQLTSKIIELLTGEDLDYLEEDTNFYRDIKVEKSQMLHLSGGSSNGNPPERCPHPFYSRDSTQEHLTIPHHHQVDGSSTGNPPERCPRPLYSRDSTQEHLTIPHHHQVDGSINGNPPEGCPRPLYSWDSTQEHLTIPHHHQVDGS